MCLGAIGKSLSLSMCRSKLLPRTSFVLAEGKRVVKTMQRIQPSSDTLRGGWTVCACA